VCLLVQSQPAFNFAPMRFASWGGPAKAWCARVAYLWVCGCGSSRTMALVFGSSVGEMTSCCDVAAYVWLLRCFLWTCSDTMSHVCHRNFRSVLRHALVFGHPPHLMVCISHNSTAISPQ